MTFDDWRDVDPAELQPLYDAESRRWSAALGWDLAPTWTIVENARRAGHVAGLLARGSGGRVAGWTFYILHEGILQIGGLVGAQASTVRALLDRAMQSPEARLARSFSAFLFPASASLPSALVRQRYAVAEHPYLLKPLVDDEAPGDLSPDLRLRTLADVDPADVVRLLARAYAGLPEARCFAPDARLDQWARYVGQLLTTPAIGRYMPSASYAVVRRAENQLAAVVITTSLSPDTAHIAQVVVDPTCRRSGVARYALLAASAAARAAGHSRMTLIVSRDNEPARTLYGRLGFVETACFLYASRPALMRQPLATRSSARIVPATRN